MTSQNPATPQFGAGRALGFFLEVARAKPGSFLALSLLHLAVYTGAGLVMLLPMAMHGEAFMSATMDPGADPTEILSAMAGYMGGSLLAYLLFAVLAVWVEAVWLRLMTRGEGSLLPRPGDYGRVLLASILIFAIMVGAYMAGLIVVLIPAVIAGAFDPHLLAGLLGGVGVIALLVLLIWLGVRLSVLPAMCVLERRFALGRAFGGTGKIFWPLLGAWFLLVLIYIGLMIVAMVAVWAMPGPYSEAMFAGFEHIGDPAGQFAAYGQIFSSPGAIVSTLLSMAVSLAIYLPGSWIARGIASRAAIDIAESAKPPVPVSGGDREGDSASGADPRTPTDPSGDAAPGGESGEDGKD